MIIYYAPLIAENNAMNLLDQAEPDRVLPHIMKNSFTDFNLEKNIQSNFKVCPAFKENFNNTFALRFTHNFTLNVKDGYAWSDDTTEEFMKSQMRYRTEDKRFLGFNLFYVFFSEKSVIMSALPSYFEDNEFNKSCILVPGQYDISKWFRPIECSFIFRDGLQQVAMKKNDIYAYLKFNTEEKIEFKKFFINEELKALIPHFTNYNKKQSKYAKNMLYFYNAFSRSMLRKKILGLIKGNLL